MRSCDRPWHQQIISLATTSDIGVIESETVMVTRFSCNHMRKQESGSSTPADPRNQGQISYPSDRVRSKTSESFV
jgi:hypothetical protein